MIKFNWDKADLNRDFPDCKNLRQVISKIENDFNQRGEVICEIRLNGVVLSESDEAKYSENSLGDISEISVRSNKPGNLICEALDSARGFIPDLESACLRAAETFRGADLNQAQKMFHEALEGCQWVIDTIIHVRGAASGIGKPIAQAERWFEAEKVIARVITEVSDAYTNSDYVLVADLLEYELTTALTIWREALDSERANRT